ncbi:endonuclease domain-containing protein [Arenimonas alkanexedens]
MTEAEHRLWFHLRAHRFAGFKFKRQQPLGAYIVDFVAFRHRLVVEADGGQHHASLRDGVRDAWLAGQGFRVLRFWNHEVLQNTQGVLDEIWRALCAGPSPPAPLPQGERGAKPPGS